MNRLVYATACLIAAKESVLMAYGIRPQSLFSADAAWIHGVFTMSWLLVGVAVAIRGCE